MSKGRFGSLAEIVGSQHLSSAIHQTAEPKSALISESRCSANGQYRKFACAMGFVGIGLTLAPESDFGLPGSLPDDLNYDALSN